MEEDSIDPDFSFAGRVRVLSPQELRELIQVATVGMEDDHPLKRALLRGIGVHHSGLPTKYRQVVEILFRCHYLRVVIATGGQVIPLLQTMSAAVLIACTLVVVQAFCVPWHALASHVGFEAHWGTAARSCSSCATCTWVIYGSFSFTPALHVVQ